MAPSSVAFRPRAADEVQSTLGLIAPTQNRRSHAVIGDLVVQLGFARREVVDAAAEKSQQEGRLTGQILVESGAIRPDQLARVLAERFGVDYLDVSQYEVDQEALALIDREMAKRYQAVPVGFLPDGTVLLAMADPTNVLTLDEVSMLTGRPMRPVAVAHEDILGLLSRAAASRERPSSFPVDGSTPQQEQVVVLSEGPDADAPAIKLVTEIITRAVELGASDIHLDPADDDMRVMFRIDGILVAETPIARSMAASVVSRIKIMADMNIAQRRVPQDGRVRVSISRHEVDLRVVTLPLVGGEGVVMRVLDAGAVVRDLSSLGLDIRDRERFVGAVGRPHGAVLVTGPTGSGKSTTLYSALGVVNDGKRSIFTIEDPVESPLEGIKQMQVAMKSGVSFATGLRSILRADPDVIMVGEIRDKETAEIAIQAALTGHLMLSTLHTRDAPSALARLIDMGIETFMVAAAIDCVVAQRLARSLCPHCKQPARLPARVLEQYDLRDGQAFEPVGCTRCGRSGFRGRLGLYEVLEVGEELRGLVLAQRGMGDLAAAALRTGMRTMRQDGLEKVRKGLTSLAEVSRVTAAAG